MHGLTSVERRSINVVSQFREYACIEGIGRLPLRDALLSGARPPAPVGPPREFYTSEALTAHLAATFNDSQFKAIRAAARGDHGESESLIWFGLI